MVSAQRSTSTRRRRLLHLASGVASDHRILIRKRATLLSLFLLLGLGGLLARVVQLQVVQASRLQTLAQRQQLSATVLQPRRGRIFDRHGRPLAVNLDATSIYAAPHLINDRHAFAKVIAPVMSLSVAEVERRVAGGRYFAWLARKVSPEVLTRVKASGLGEQIGFLTEDRRVYPNGPLAAHVVGFVGIDNQGLGGVELTYEKVLRGRAGKAVAERDGVGRVLVETQRLVQVPEDGEDLVLTVDQVIQHIAERELETATARTKARQGSITVIDPKSGEVLALAVWPTYDPNAGGQARPERWLDRPLAQVYEPGSTFKLFLAAAALDSGQVLPGERVFCNGFVRVAGNHIIRDAHNEKHGWQTIGDIVKNSCNVGAAQFASRLGKALFYTYIGRFGFGEAVGIDLPGEVKGIVPPPSAWLGPGLQTIALGQGVSITALQLVAAATAFANEGVMVRPHVIRAIRDSQGRVISVSGREPIRQVIQPVTAEAIVQMMIAAVEEGTGTQAKVAGYTVAGKTGTAQKPAPSGGYDPNGFVASFLGLVPAENPKLLILVVLDEPRGQYFGGAIAAPVFSDVAAQALWYLRIPPTSGGSQSPVTVPGGSADRSPPAGR